MFTDSTTKLCFFLMFYQYKYEKEIFVENYDLLEDAYIFFRKTIMDLERTEKLISWFETRKETAELIERIDIENLLELIERHKEIYKY